MIKFLKPSPGRVLTAILLSLFVMRLPLLFSSTEEWVVAALILLFFLVVPDQKGIKGGVIAGAFSLVFAGIGHWYVREYVRGVIFFVTAVFAYMTTDYSSKSWVLNNILFILAAIDAFSFGKRRIGIF